jgi:hypothetical protein
LVQGQRLGQPLKSKGTGGVFQKGPHRSANGQYRISEGEQSMKAVRFDRYGDIEVLHVVDVPVPEPAQGQAVVKVKAASINPGEAKIREGVFHRTVFRPARVATWPES